MPNPRRALVWRPHRLYLEHGLIVLLFAASLGSAITALASV